MALGTSRLLIFRHRYDALETPRLAVFLLAMFLDLVFPVVRVLAVFGFGHAHVMHLALIVHDYVVAFKILGAFEGHFAIRIVRATFPFHAILPVVLIGWCSPNFNFGRQWAVGRANGPQRW